MRAQTPSVRIGTAARLFGGALLATTLFSARSASAIGDGAPVDMNRFHPATGNAKILTVDLADVGPHLQVVPQFFMHYANRPLVFYLGPNPAVDLIKHRLTGDFSVSIALWRRLQISLALPVTFFQCAGRSPAVGVDGSLGFPPAVCDNAALQEVDFPPALDASRLPPKELATAGQEDLRLGLKGVLWNNNRSTNPLGAFFGVGASGDLSIPTGNANSYLGSRLPTFTLRLIGHLQFRRLTAALNFGGTFGSTEQLYNIKTGSGLSYGVGLQLEMFRYRLMPFYAVAEVFGLTHYPFDSLRTSPAELSLALKASCKEWTFFVGGGPGLNPGYGVPDGRVFAGVTYAWQKIPQTPKPAPPPPDVCPNLPGPQEHIPDGMVRDEATGFCALPPDECPNLPGAQAQIPQGLVKDEKTGACNAPPVKPPPVCDPEKEDCPDRPKAPIKAEVVGSKINLSERIFFDFDKDTIKPISFPILDEVVNVLKAVPTIRRLRIEGHTDNLGSDPYNLDLSHRRAASVMVYLVEHGVEPRRLTAAGFGFRCPIVDNDTPDNQAKNRRVDFIILEHEGLKVEEPRCKVPPQPPLPGQKKPGGRQTGRPGVKPAVKPGTPAAQKPATTTPAKPAVQKPATGAK